jgi:hypothetical protein
MRTKENIRGSIFVNDVLRTPNGLLPFDITQTARSTMLSEISAMSPLWSSLQERYYRTVA